MTILDQLADYARIRVAKDMEKISLQTMRDLAEAGGKANGQAFVKALEEPGMSFICEVKKASPSKGIIAKDFPYVEIGRSYQAAGADAISCLTEPRWFLGSDQIFTEIRQAVTTPMLRKDFTVDQYQIYQAKLMGANAILLICSILDTKTIASCLELCDSLGLAALVEAHTEEEIASAVSAGAKIIGVNNRNLKNFTVDFSNAARLRDLIPPEALYVAESGVTGPEDARALYSIGADAALIGEAFMRAEDKGQLLKDMKAACR